MLRRVSPVGVASDAQLVGLRCRAQVCQRSLGSLSKAVCAAPLMAMVAALVAVGSVASTDDHRRLLAMHQRTAEVRRDLR